MSDDTTHEDDTKPSATDATREEYLASLGVSYAAAFVPQSVSRNRSEKAKSLNWVVTLTRGAQVISTDYMQGIGHVPGYSPYKVRASNDEWRMQQDREKANETGKYPVSLYLKKPLPAPTASAVLSSLLLDADAGAESFDEFCGNFGYDTDSRKAEATWRVCSEMFAQIRRMFSRDELDTLRTMWEGY